MHVDSLDTKFQTCSANNDCSTNNEKKILVEGLTEHSTMEINEEKISIEGLPKRSIMELNATTLEESFVPSTKTHSEKYIFKSQAERSERVNYSHIMALNGGSSKRIRASRTWHASKDVSKSSQIHCGYAWNKHKQKHTIEDSFSDPSVAGCFIWSNGHCVASVMELCCPKDQSHHPLAEARMNWPQELLARGFEPATWWIFNTNKLDKNAVSETLREPSKQRLSNALKQTQQRLSDLQIDLETSASFLENECYKKYEKTGKSFYCPQLASTVRWLSSTNSAELRNRLGDNTSPTTKNVTVAENSSLTSLALLDHGPIESSTKEFHVGAISETSSSALQSNSKDIRVPPIPSISEFVSSRKSKDNQLLMSEKQSPGRAQKNLEKRMRLHYVKLVILFGACARFS
ncbi:uncharacterized protein LOC130795329 [Actinidia eriantha]|uniref:uncharacterized protein LOC130795329 n=1 Tax=Actinidia eriantha TaxID=165200 RepID=UPI0025882C74|nr:uncharacterized protein LOC130795329 [Actinidia eriantha]